jgi:iron complex outermembrane receptor protein
MKSLRFTYFALLSVLASRALSQNNSVASAPVQRLDAVVVSAGPDPKTSFDLAQGTSVLSGDELRRLVQSTLGETLAGTAGVSSTYHGPGASRPVIRGLSGDRVRVLDNGVGTLDASNVSPDHATAVEPLFASRIEVLRGPSTLLFGSSAVGGAVNVISNAIPHTPPDGQARGTLETRLGGAARESALVLSTGGGANGFNVQVNALTQRTRDLEIPGVARIDPDAPRQQPAGRLPNSAANTFSGSVGGTVFWSQGHAGAAVSHRETEYGVPTGEEEPITIRLRQTRVDLESEVAAPFPGVRSLRARVGQGDYWHAELGEGTHVHSTFTNQASEGRLELAHAALGPWNGMVGLQAGRSDFAAVGEEVATPPSVTDMAAIFALEETKLGELTTVQFGGRAETQQVKLGELNAALPPVPGYAARSSTTRRLAGASGSLGLVFQPTKHWSFAGSVAESTRLPTAQELFSHGPHGGTGTYEVGQTGLKPERSTGVDLSVRHRGPRVSGSISVFTHEFRGYIYQEEISSRLVPPANNPENLRVMQYVARDAKFNGVEAELTFHLLTGTSRRLDLDLGTDLVRATAKGSGEHLPRIPARRYTAKLTYDNGSFGGALEVRRTATQTRTAAGESATPGHTLLHASATWRIADARRTWEVFLRGTNLTNAVAREHASFLKEFAPLPGRGLGVGVRMHF